VQELRNLAATNNDVSIETYLNETGLDIDDIYANDKSWTEMCRDADINTLPSGPNEKALLRAAGRLLHVDDPDRLIAYIRFVNLKNPPITGPKIILIPLKD
jgi:hypothetical protein